MEVLSYKCPNCDGELVFDPASQKFHCGYCLSDFTKQELDAQTVQQKDGPAQQDAAQSAGEAADAAQEEPAEAVFTCPSCGAEIVTDETTAATYCYYCHNPVVLSGRLDGNFRPDLVIPFAIDREQAVREFLHWARKRKFIPRAFFNAKQVEKITGVYCPYWVTNCDADAAMTARATKVRTWRSGDRQYTETEHYQVTRAGALHFEELTRNALNKADHWFADRVRPFDFSAAKPFSAAYLSGFQAEKRNVERAELQQGVDTEVQKYAELLLRDTAQGYSAVIPEGTQCTLKNEHWHYVLVPVWVLTYQAHNGKKYYYAMNGQTGNVTGELPVDYGRLAALAAAIAVPLFALLTLGGYFL